MSVFEETWLTPPAQGCNCGGGSYGNEVLIDMESGMEAELVPLGLSKQARLPFTVVLPMQVVAQIAGLPRQFRVDKPDQLVPIPVKEWLIQDTRYRRLFDDSELADGEKKENAENAGVIKTGRKKKDNSPDENAGGEKESLTPDGEKPGDSPDGNADGEK